MIRLEAKLGKPLFTRTGRSAVLNETGRRVLEKASNFLTLSETLTDPIEPDAQTGQLRIGAIASVHPTLLRRVLPIFAAEFPRVQIKVVPGTSQDLMDQIDAANLDLAIIIRPSFGLAQPFVWTELLQERFVLVAPKSSNINTVREALLSLPFLRYNRALLWRQTSGAVLGDARHHSSGTGWNLTIFQPSSQWVADGFGIAILPQIAAYAHKFSHVQVAALDAPNFIRQVGIIGATTATAPAHKFIQLCEQSPL